MNSTTSITDLSKIPLAVNPNGDPPNFVNPPSLEATINRFGATLVAISVIVLALRLVANIKHTGRLGLDDILCTFGQICGFAYFALVSSLARDGAGRHTWDVPASIVTVSFIKRQFATQMIVGPMIWSVKAAILALYIRTFQSVRWMRITCYASIVFTGLFYMSSSVVAAVYCLPRNGAPWGQAAFARCASPVISAVVIGVFGVVADLIIFIMPLPIIWGLHLSLRKKVGVFVVFATALLMVVTSLVSLAYRVKTYLGKDVSWDGTSVSITAFAEVFGTVIVGCAPALSSFWHNIFVKSSLYSSLQLRLHSQSRNSTTQEHSKKRHRYSSETNLRSDHVPGHLYSLRRTASASTDEDIAMSTMVTRSTSTTQMTTQV